jgi:hypothetical protein
MQTNVDREEALLFSLQIYGFADQSLHVCGFVICGLAQVRNLRICDCAMSPRICGPTFAVQCYDAYRVPNFFLPALHDTQSS